MLSKDTREKPQSDFPGEINYVTNSHGGEIEVHVPRNLDEMLDWLDANPSKLGGNPLHIGFDGVHLTLTKGEKYPYDAMLDLDTHPVAEQTTHELEALAILKESIKDRAFDKLSQRVNTMESQLQALAKLVQDSFSK